MSSGEAEEIRRFLAGDEGAFQAIMNRWHRPIVNFLYRCTGSQDDAAEKPSRPSPVDSAI